MRDKSSAFLQRKKDSNWKRVVTTITGIPLNEGDYYILRNGNIVYLMDNLSISDNGNTPFYMRVKGTGEMIGSVDWDGRHICQPWCSDCDIIGVYDRPSLNTANMI
jgi:hypothetical protein